MIKINAKGIDGYAVQPSIDAQAAKQLCSDIKNKNIGFVDLAPTKQVYQLIQKLGKSGNNLISFLDHHTDTKDNNDRHDGLKCKFKETVLCSRVEAPSCWHIVDDSHWKNNRIDSVVFHADIDGYLAFLKGCGLKYNGMRYDSDIMDGAAVNRSLSGTGVVLVSAFEYLVTKYSMNQEKHFSDKQKVFQVFADFLCNGASPEWEKMREDVQTARVVAEWNAHRMIKRTMVLDGNICHSTLGESPCAIHLWKKWCVKNFKPKLFAITAVGHLGMQVFVEVIRNNRIDIREYLPPGVVGKAKFRAQMPVDKFAEFRNNFRG